MRGKYEIRAVNFGEHTIRTADEYQKVLDEATPIYKDSFAEVVEYLGGKPHRERAGWSACVGNTDYVITKI